MDLSIDSNCIEAMPVVNGAALKQCPADRAYVESRKSQRGPCNAHGFTLTANALRRELVLLVFIFFFQPQNRCSIQSHTTVSRHLALAVPLPAQQARLLLMLQSDRNPSHTHVTRTRTGDTGQSGTIQTLTKKHSRSHSLAEQFRKTRTTLQKKKKSETTTTPRLSESPRVRRKHPPASSPRLGSPRRSSPPPPCS